MLDNKLKDNEIKKAWECCSSQPQELCCNCPIDISKIKGGCITVLTTNALDLINRLQSENERLTHITRNLIGEIKAEAYKEFAERLKEKSFQSFGNYGITRDVVEVCDIDNIIKEMVGDKE